jgi:stage II sporulation protein AA (anti-sigma F factor antagonist)
MDSFLPQSVRRVSNSHRPACSLQSESAIFWPQTSGPLIVGGVVLRLTRDVYLHSGADPELDQPWRDREGPFAPICRTVHNTSWARSFEADYGRLNWRGCSAVPGFARHPPFCSCEQVCTPKRCSLGMSVFDRSVRIATAGHNVLVIEVLVEQIRDPDTSYALRDEMLSLIDPEKISHVVLDLQHVTFVGSIGFLAFLAVRRRLENGQIVICNLWEPVRQTFQICRLISNDPAVTAPFRVEDSLEAALARCAQ